MFPYRRHSDIPNVDGASIQFIPKSNNLIFENLCPVNNKTTKPSWWKQLSTDEGKLRRCSGSLDLLSLGYTINMWGSCLVQPTQTGSNWIVTFDTLLDDVFESDIFTYAQTGGCPITDVRKNKETNCVNLKNPWLVKTAKGYSSLVLPISYEPNNNYTVLAGIVNTDYYHHLNIVLNVLTDKPFEIPYGTPLAHIIPFSRREENEMEILDDSAYKLLNTVGFGSVYIPRSIKGLYKRTQRKKDRL